MPRKTAKPYIKVNDLGNELRVSYYVVRNTKAMHAKTILVPKGDPAQFELLNTELITDVRDTFGSQRK